MRRPLRAPAHLCHSPAAAPATLPADAIFAVVIVVVAIVADVDPPRGAIAIANAIAIAAPDWRIVGSAMATALLFHRGGVGHGRADEQILWKW
jgi:hypothetical protein